MGVHCSKLRNIVHPIFLLNVLLLPKDQTKVFYSVTDLKGVRVVRFIYHFKLMRKFIEKLLKKTPS